MLWAKNIGLFLWEKKIWIISVLCVGLSISLVLFAHWSRSAPARYQSRVQKDREVIIKARDRLLSLPVPDDTQPGQLQGYASYLSNSLDQTEKQIPTTIRPLSRWADMLQKVHKSKLVNEEIVSPSQVYKAANNNLVQASQLVDYHSEVWTGLVKLLEYSPAVDFQKFDPKSADTKERISRARTGLAQVKKSISKPKTKYKDPRHDQLVTLVNQAEDQLTLLEKDGNTSRWTEQIKLIQKQIINNRSDFWKESLENVIKSLNATNGQLSQLENNFSLIRP